MNIDGYSNGAPFPINGLAIAHDYFLSWGLPYIQKQWPQLIGRIAAGRLSGSDVIGGDDEISRDHNWGPQFAIFLCEEDFTAHGLTLRKTMNAAAPKLWHGFHVAGGGDKNVLVECIPVYFKNLFGLERPPRTAGEWPLGLNESHLYFLRHGQIWLDQLGELSAWRAALHEYPEHILYHRLAEECFRVWHHGEYNFVQRIARRKDTLARTLAFGEFTAGLMRLIFLTKGDFTPYWKWLGHQFRKLPNAAAFLPELESLFKSTEWSQQAELIKLLSARLHHHLLSSGYVAGDTNKRNEWLLPLLNDHNELNSRADELKGEAMKTSH